MIPWYLRDINAATSSNCRGSEAPSISLFSACIVVIFIKWYFSFMNTTVKIPLLISRRWEICRYRSYLLVQLYRHEAVIKFLIKDIPMKSVCRQKLEFLRIIHVSCLPINLTWHLWESAIAMTNRSLEFRIFTWPLISITSSIEIALPLLSWWHVCKYVTAFLISPTDVSMILSNAPASKATFSFAKLKWFSSLYKLNFNKPAMLCNLSNIEDAGNALNLNLAHLLARGSIKRVT